MITDVLLDYLWFLVKCNGEASLATIDPFMFVDKALLCNDTKPYIQMRFTVCHDSWIVWLNWFRLLIMYLKTQSVPFPHIVLTSILVLRCVINTIYQTLPPLFRSSHWLPLALSFLLSVWMWGRWPSKRSLTQFLHLRFNVL